MASMVISDQVVKNPGGKVFFLANIIALAAQHYDEKQYIPGSKVDHITGFTVVQIHFLMFCCKRIKMIVCTAGILLNDHVLPQQGLFE